MSRDSQADAADSRRRRDRRIRLVSLLAIGGALLGLVVLHLQNRPPEDPRILLQRARAALDARDYERSRSLAEAAVDSPLFASEARLIAAEAERGQRHFVEAVALLDRVPDSDTAYARRARVAAAEILFFDEHRMSDAEQQLRRALAIDADDGEALERLVQILMTSGRWQQAAPSLLRLVRLKEFHNLHLYVLAAGDRVAVDVESLPQFAAADPADPAPQIALAAAAAQEHPDDGERRLRSVLATNPDRCEAQSLWGRLRARKGDAREFVAWFSNLSPACTEHADVWAAAGEWAEAADLRDVAIRCYWESLRRDPSRPLVNYRVGQLLLDQGLPTEAEPFLNRASALQDFLSAIEVAKTGSDLDQLARVTQLAEQLGLDWEAYGWSVLTLHLDDKLQWAQDNVKRFEAVLRDWPLERTDARGRIGDQHDLSRYPLPDSAALAGTSNPEPVEPPSASRANIECRFDDRAAEFGLKFEYRNGGRPLDDGLQHMYELLGGGAGVLDYDRDGWPDLYLAQGSDWPPDSRQEDALDRLFRNGAGTRAVDVTLSANVKEPGFSQGVAVADFDADGFPDLYVGAIGPNRFFRNNGDGTFAELPAALGTAGDDWTSSCLLADLTGDALPDVYVVNYLAGEDVFTRVCPDESGALRLSCAQKEFPAAQDRAYVNRGDGSFAERTGTAGIVSPEGRGLGIVCFRLDDATTLFVANDSDANNLFIPAVGDAQSAPHYNDEAWTRGAAVDGQGRAQACMGIAAGDPNRDGRFDLFVTNFDGELNTLYLQHADGGFEDATVPFQLANDSLPLVGFGTQFLDADLDGWEDLFVTNGHVNDLRPSGRMYQMPPHLFRNESGRRFQLCPKQSCGTYFDGEYLGRGAAKLDWNCDGSPDLVVTHLDAPTSLLINAATTPNHFLSLRLVGASSERDGTGTVARMQTASHEATFQLTAGDGYLCSNERTLMIGLGAADRVQELTIAWPSGRVDRHLNLPADERLICVEGRTCFVQPAAQPAQIQASPE